MSFPAAILLGLAFSFAALASSPAQIMRQPPTPAERAYAVKVGWASAATQLGAALRVAYRPGNGEAAGSVGNAAFQSWLLLYRWCELLARPAPAPTHLSPELSFSNLVAPRPVPATLADGLDPDFLRAMVADETFLRAWFANLTARDDAPAALKILAEIWRGEPAKWAEYRNLAIALALVRDQRPPSWWPHAQVRPADVPKTSLPPLAEFRFWIASNEGQRLFNDLRQLDAEELKFVVDAPIATSELEWAQKNTRFPRADFGRAFSSIRYAYGRLEGQVYTWPDGPYTLAAIRDRGGICVDQAYFAMLAGKARGLPTLYFSGQGADGGHAWFGYLKGPGRWDMDCGRYENQNYVVGQAIDPQSWLPINDHELAALAQSFRRTPAYRASQDDLAMARLFAAAGDPRRELAALDSAIGISPRNDLAWAAKGEFLVRTTADPATQRAFHAAAIKQFANNDDLKVVHQQALAALARGGGDEDSAQAMESQIISQNRRGRSDLSVNAAAARLAALVEARKYEDAMREYRNLLSRLGRTSGGNFFYDIVRPFAVALARSGDYSSAERAVEAARGTLRPESDSILDQDFAKLENFVKKPAAAR